MTVSITPARRIVAGDGTANPITIDFPFEDGDDIEVYERVTATGVATLKINGTDYTVAGGGGGTGSLTPAAAVSVSVTWVIRRRTDPTQETRYRTLNAFPAESIELSYDHAILLIQELQEVLARCLFFPPEEPDASLGALPNAVLRAGGILGFDGAGKPQITAITNPVIDTAVLWVVAAAQPGIQNGRSWLDTSVGNQVTWRYCDGANYINMLTISHTGDIISASPSLAVLSQSNIFTAQQTISRNGTLTLDLESTTNSAASGPILKLRRARTPSVSDLIGEIRWESRDGAGNLENAIALQGEVVDPTNGSEDYRLKIQTQTGGGGLTDKLIIEKGTYTPGVTGGDPGLGIINAGGLRINNVSVPVGLADAAAMETAASTTLATSPGLQQRHPGHPKTQLRFNGTGTIAIDRDYGILNLSDNGTGTYGENYDVAFSDTTYNALYGYDVAIGSGNNFTAIGVSSLTTITFNLLTFNNTPTLVDAEFICLQHAGDQ